MTINNCTFGGTVTNIGDARTEPGREWINFTIIVPGSGKRKEDGRDDALFMRCVCFGKTAIFASKYMHLKQKAVVIGKLEKRRYKDKSGVEKDGYQLKVFELQLVKDYDATTNAPAQEEYVAQPAKTSEEDIIIPGEDDMF